MTELLRAALDLQQFCRQREWRCCFIGGIALLRWGRARETVGADLALWTDLGREEEFINPLIQRFPTRIPDAVSFAIAHRVLLLRSDAGVGLDISLSAIPFEKSVIDRSSDYEFAPGIALTTCCAEDLVVLKVFAGRGQDWVDIEGILRRLGDSLHWERIHESLLPLAPLLEGRSMSQELEDCRRRVQDR